MGQAVSLLAIFAVRVTEYRDYQPFSATPELWKHLCLSEGSLSTKQGCLLS